MSHLIRQEVDPVLTGSIWDLTPTLTQVQKSCFTHLSSSIDLVGKLDLVEGHRRLHPVRSKVGRVGVDVDAAVAPPLPAALRPAGRHPLSVHKLPAAAVGRHEVEQEGVHGAGVQARHADLQHREHSAARTKHVTVSHQNHQHIWNNYESAVSAVVTVLL